MRFAQDDNDNISEDLLAVSQPTERADSTVQATLRYHSMSWGSTVDGPGVRVVLFLHGCEWRCPWCHAPHLWSDNDRLLFIESRCLQCRACVNACPRGVHGFEDGRHVLRREDCLLCGRCRDACPTVLTTSSMSGALAMPYRTSSAGAIFRGMSPQLAMLRHIGGLTVSGGEPLLQSEAVGALLSLCREAGFSTAVETSGAARASSVEKLLGLVDHWLYGIRPVPEESGRLPPAATVLKNLAILARHCPERVTLRMPIIPGYTDTTEVMDNAARIMRDFGLKTIQLLPFNPFWEHYHSAIGQKPPCEFSLAGAAMAAQAMAEGLSAQELRVTIVD